jgi:hypothetical protein
MSKFREAAFRAGKAAVAGKVKVHRKKMAAVADAAAAASSSAEARQLKVITQLSVKCDFEPEGNGADGILSVRKGDKLRFLKEQHGWFQAQLVDGTVGFVAPAHCKSKMREVGVPLTEYPERFN